MSSVMFVSWRLPCESVREDEVQKRELAADEMALDMITHFFSDKTDYARARASLCGTLFLSMVHLWETGIERLTGSPQIAHTHSHPVFKARLERFTDALSKVPGEKTPAWYQFTHNALTDFTPERYRETQQSDDFDKYLYMITEYLGAKAESKLGKLALASGPTSLEFYLNP